MKKGKVSFGSMATYSVEILKGEEVMKGIPVIAVQRRRDTERYRKGHGIRI